MTYQVNDHIHGFTMQRIREIPQGHATLHEMVHDVTGATLIYVQTEDANKLFSVAFKTIPADDTGVFHILEHSVLSGSEKYPLREPFVELLKSSMNTFLNALTFPDKTLYPVSSRNNKDFHNLMGVYLDAVFAPKAMTNPNIFYQEGWHYELTEDQQTPIYKGVVYNEMKGAESSVDSVIRNVLKRMLYGETCYGFSSGGDVEKIPTLTYQMYQDMYHKYYHPTNAVFYLEGNLELESALADIQEYLKDFEGKGPTFTIPYAEPSESNTVVGYYDRGEEEEDEASAHIAYAKLNGTYKDVREIAAIELISDYLTGSNEAPLSKAVLGSGLAEDFSMGIQDGIKQPYFQMNVTNCRYEDHEEIHRIIFDTAKKLIAEGLNRHDMGASLNEMEFQVREESEPKALYRNIRVLDSAIYGGDPMLYLDVDDVFTFLRQQLDTDYYERLAEKLFSMEHMQVVHMLPSAEIGEQKRAEEAKRLEAASAAWTETDRQEILELNRKLLEWQQTPDTPEILAMIPKLSLTDVDPKPIPHQMEVKEYRGVTVLHHGDGNNGIAYLNLYFPIPWRNQKTLSDLMLLPSMLGCLSTETREPLDFQTDCQEHLGDLSYNIITETEIGNMESTRLYFEVSISALEKEIPEALRLAREVLMTTRFEEDDLICQKLAQKVEGMRRGIIGSGQNYALSYTASADIAEAAAQEAMNGLTAYWRTKEIEGHYEEYKDEVIALWKKAQKELFGNLELLSVTSNRALEEVIDLDAWIDTFACGKDIVEAISTVDIRRKDIPEKTAVAIPAGISFAVSRSNMTRLGSAYGPKWRVLSNILRFGYLWSEIRVQGGAYGTGANFSSLNEIGFHSYRDPDPIRSLKVYQGVADYIRAYVEETDSLESAIISTLAYMDPLLSASDIGDHYDSAYMRGSTYESRLKFRQEMIQLTPQDLLECADALEKMADDHRECVVGHADVVKKLEEEGFVVKNI